MIPLDYLALRLMRRLLPRGAMRWALRQRLGAVPGMETRSPLAAADRYVHALRAAGRGLEGKTILVFGYGGYFGLGVELLRRGARHVVLCDPYAEPARAANRELAEQAAPYLRLAGGEAVADPAWITPVPEDIRSFVRRANTLVDLVLSSSVLEHLSEPKAIVAALASATASDGLQLHFVDLRDHYFRRPFEMLCHSPEVWRRFLNPPSHLNRLRVWDYERLFRAHFAEVRWEALSSDVEGLRQARRRIRREFLSGDEALDAVTRIALWAAQPRRAGSGREQPRGVA
jgi:hypothetical protein